ncbi:MAG: NAD(P)/FAD-dependent oxidoreductase [bacterium]|nr:NAD(P)/FAD-dependent oxidoreductase [bacterium]
MGIGIVGAGISGSYLAYQLARQGYAVELFDPKAPWEKPCGGGITYRTLRDFPVLRDFRSASVSARQLHLIGAGGERCTVEWELPLTVASRESLGRYLLEKAVAQGATLVPRRVQQVTPVDSRWRIETDRETGYCDFLVGADGVGSLVRRRLASPFQTGDTTLAVGYWIDGPGLVDMTIGFVPSITGYVWLFPRGDHVSAGICARRGEMSGRKLRELLDTFLRRHTPNLMESKRRAYGALIPALTAGRLAENRICGDNWALAGDASGLVNPLTGEGIYYAFQSAELLARGIAGGRIDDYARSCRSAIVPELSRAASYVRYFFDPRISNRLVALVQENETVRRLLGRLISGEQSYGSLKKELVMALPAKSGLDFLYRWVQRVSGRPGEST